MSRSRLLDICSAARRGCLRPAAAGLELFVLDAPHLYARRRSLSRAGRAGLAGQRIPLRRAGARCRESAQGLVGRATGPTSCMRTTGRRD